MTKLVFTILGLFLLASLVMAILKGVALLIVVAIGLVLLQGLYRIRPAAFYAVCVVGLVGITPGYVWPWAGAAALLWGVLEFAQAVRLRSQRSKTFPLRLPE